MAVSAEVAVRYEDLRRHILDGGGSRPRLGLAVLVREGVAAWITTCAMVSRAMAPAPDPSDGAVLELCALTDTLILDEDGLYDPAQFNDRLLLGLKGTMSEAELYVLRARLRGGIVHKARRGELRVRLPVGLVHDAQGRVGLDPDQQVQASVRLLFETFLRTGTAHAVVKHFHREHLQFPRYLSSGPRKGEAVWEPIDLWRVLSVLKNPRYAGAYAFGRGCWKKQPDGRASPEKLNRRQIRL